MLAHWADGAVDAVAISHEHPDHCVDLHGLFRMRLHGGAGGLRLPLYCPPGVLDLLQGLEPAPCWPRKRILSSGSAR